MPQGGIDRGEEPWPAALRELREETNIHSVERLGEIGEWLNYDIPRDLIGEAWNGKFAARRRSGSRCVSPGLKSEIDVANPDGSAHAEFSEWRWSRYKTCRTWWCRSNDRSTSASSRIQQITR